MNTNDVLNKLIAEIERQMNECIGRFGEIHKLPEYRCLKNIHSYITSLQQEQPSLPSNLDEAALKAYPKMSRLSEPHGVIPADNKTHYLGDANEENRVAFKAGAEWMAGQGYTKEETVYFERLCDENRIMVDLGWGEPERGGFNPGDKVVVQIRKK